MTARKIKPASDVKIMGYSFKSRNRDAHLDRIGAFSISSQIKQIDNIDEKFDLVEESNPLHYIFGKKRLPINGMDYADWVEKLEVM